MLFANDGHPPLTLYVLQTAYEFSVLVNFAACAFVYVAHLEGYENSWLASVEDLGSRLDEFETYVAAVYFATATVSTVGFGDVSATTTAERIVATLSMTLGATYYAYLVGSVATLVERFGAAHGRRAAFREKMVELRAFLTRHPDVPRELRARIAAYFADAWLRTNTSDRDRAAGTRTTTHCSRRSLTVYVSRPASVSPNRTCVVSSRGRANERCGPSPNVSSGVRLREARASPYQVAR